MFTASQKFNKRVRYRIGFAGWACIQHISMGNCPVTRLLTGVDISGKKVVVQHYGVLKLTRVAKEPRGWREVVPSRVTDL